MARPTREEAWRLLTEYTQNQSLRRHALAVEASMRELARSAGVVQADESETWGLVGMLHDFDYERFPTEDGHVWRGMEILRERGWPEDFVLAIGGHAFYTGIERTTPMMRAILAADELTGFVSACALVRPSKSVLDLEASSVIKRMKDKAFARAVNREDLRKGAEEIGLPLDQHITNVIAFMREQADALGLRGSL